MPVIAYECSKLLAKYPMFNAYFNGNSVAYYKDVHIGFAVDMDKGLKVLKLTNTPVTGDAFAPFKGRKMNSIRLMGCPNIDDAAMEHIGSVHEQ